MLICDSGVSCGCISKDGGERIVDPMMLRNSGKAGARCTHYWGPLALGIA